MALTQSAEKGAMTTDEQIQELLLETTTLIHHLHLAEFERSSTCLVQLTMAEDDARRVAEMIDTLRTKVSNQVADQL